MSESINLAFKDAVIRNQVKEIKRLLSEGVNINSILNSDRDTALHYASYLLMPKLVDFLIENKADLNVINENEYTPLMNACSSGGVKGSAIALKLIEAGADVTYIRQSDEKTALNCAVANLIGKSCSTEVIQALIDRGACVDGVPNAVQTPLMLAARTNNIQSIEILLQNGANPSLPSGLPWAKGFTAEELAAHEGMKKAFKYLSEYRQNGNKFV